MLLFLSGPNGHLDSPGQILVQLPGGVGCFGLVVGFVLHLDFLVEECDDDAAAEISRANSATAISRSWSSTFRVSVRVSIRPAETLAIGMRRSSVPRVPWMITKSLAVTAQGDGNLPVRQVGQAAVVNAEVDDLLGPEFSRRPSHRLLVSPLVEQANRNGQGSQPEESPRTMYPAPSFASIVATMVDLPS